MIAMPNLSLLVLLSNKVFCFCAISFVGFLFRLLACLLPKNLFYSKNFIVYIFLFLYIVIQMGSGYDDDHDNDSKNPPEENILLFKDYVMFYT